MPEEGDGAEEAPTRSHWKSRLGFVLAAAGSAIGLGNLWKFPYITWENGGGLFVLVYLGCIALVGFPIMLAELLVGHRSQRNPVGAFRKLTPGSPWVIVGIMGVLTGFVILSYYSVVAGWAIEYTGRAATGTFEQRETLARQQVWRNFTEEDAHDAWRSAVVVAEGVPTERSPEVDPPLSGENLEDAWEDFRAEHPEALEEARETKQEALWEDRVASLPESERTARREELAAQSIDSRFGEFRADPVKQVTWHLIFMALTFGIVVGGISSGIERWAKVLMPVLILLLLVLLGNSMTSKGAAEGLRFMFVPDEPLPPTGILEALGHAFFTLSLGMGAMITYGSYLEEKGVESDLVKNGLMVVVLDTLIAILACLVIFPIIFGHDLQPQASPAILFTTLPNVFVDIPGGMLWASLFYLLVGFAALTSAISLLEVVVSWIVDEWEWSRLEATSLAGLAIFLFGVPSALAGGFLPYTLGDVFGVEATYEAGTLGAKFLQTNFFDLMDYIASNWLLPLGGLLIALYVSIGLDWEVGAEELDGTRGGLRTLIYKGWRVLIVSVAPLGIACIFLHQVGFLPWLIGYGS